MLEQKLVIGVFEDLTHVQHAIHALKNAGFHEENIGFAMMDKKGTIVESGREDIASDTHKAEETGAVIGGVLGGMLGVMMTAVFPGLGPVLLGAALLAGAGGGAAFGGFLGMLVEMGVPEEEARFYQKELQAGNAILTVRAGDRYSEVAAIMNDQGARDVERSLVGSSST